jgi:GNAT superfamily N-acetyltransferase
MLQIVSLTVFAILLARLVGAPKRTWLYILFLALLAMAGSQLLPSGHPLREDVGGALGILFWIGVALVPVGAYALLIRQIRRRTGTDRRPAGSHPTGLVLIPEDAALARETEAALAEEEGAAAETFSIGWREPAGALAGHARLRLHRRIGDLEMLWVAPDARGRGIGGRLLAQAGAEARQRGARELVATVASPKAAGFLAGHGFRPYGSLASGARLHLHKGLT